MSDQPEESAANLLGLDLESLKVSEQPVPATPATLNDEASKPAVKASDDPSSPVTNKETASQDAPTTPEANPEAKKVLPQGASKEKKKPYINPDRVKTGGAQRDKLSEEELAERMVRIREQNEKIKQRREDVKKDEEEFKKTQEAERVKQAKARQVQERVNNAREQNARRKLEKVQNREWDTGKPGVKSTEAKDDDATGEPNGHPLQTAKIGIRGGVRGGRGGGSRGRGRGTAVSNGPREEKLVQVAATPETGPTVGGAQTAATSS